MKLLILCLLLVFTVRGGAGQSCTDDSDCSINNSLCTDEACTCSIGYLMNESGTKCLPYVTEYSGECEENAQCEWLGPNSECRTQCLCESGYNWREGECRKFKTLGHGCNVTSECFDGYNLLAMSCNDNRCGCADDYYLRGDTDCRKIASSVNDNCMLNLDCRFDNGICRVGKCVDGPTVALDRDVREEEMSFFGNQTYHHTSRASELCEDECLGNTECYDKTETCICKKGYFFDGSDCIAELGVHVDCKADADCKIKPGKCVEGTCYCRDYYVAEQGNRNCIKTISQDNWGCLSDEWCLALGPDSYCSSQGTCNCSRNAKLDEENLLCVSDDTDDTICLSDLDCSYFPGSKCIDEVCSCTSDDMEIDKKCLPKLGSPCDDEKICIQDNSLCTPDGYCQCEPNYVAKEQVCYMIGAGLESDCEVDEQCSAAVEFSGCVDKKCSCVESYREVLGLCFADVQYNSYCTNRQNCTIFLGDTFSCRNSRCQCPTGYSLKEGVCMESSASRQSTFVVTLIVVIAGLIMVTV